MNDTGGLGKLVNAALLSLINEVRVNVCCATLLSSELVGPACGQARSSNREAGRVRLVGSDGEEGILRDVVPYIFTARLLVSVFL